MNLTTSHLIALLPLLIVSATVIVVMLGVAWQRHHFLSATLTVIGLNAALVSLLATLTVTPIQVTPLLAFDNYSVLFMALALIAALACTTLAHAYLEGFDDRREEYYMLLLCSVLGAMTLVASRHMTALFIGLELMSVPLYGMAAYAYRNRVSLEAGLKYMVLSAAASAFLLFGMALLYAESGTLEFAGIGASMNQGGHDLWLLAGIGMMVIALGFKLSLVPFHLWTPDVYEGAPAPMSAFLATVSKLAVFALLIRLFETAPVTGNDVLHTVIAVIAFASMIVGNLLALRQNNIKRLLGYSSIAHLGYLLTALVASNSLAVETVGVYMVTYVLTTLGTFGVVALVSSPYSGVDAADMSHYRGLFWRRPYLAAVMTVMMLSLAGIPMTAGFIGKFYALAVGVQSGLWWLVAGIVVGSAIGLYYYLRVMVGLYLHEGEQSRRDATDDWGQRSGGVMVLLLAIAVLVLGVYPQPMIALIDAATMATG
ncbi:NADH dehydrogenase subunit N [Kushneria sinocarnis]|uniref:NADH-quinone oxidoreductase subunit N n=1 Tax=Kushneria sinocarnis TaxID=595502 RepID=A0A420X168_9GAMM|nr:NADH-quinone oxidoreductase subunit NuoN [Kushneria sinocarnis]RKR07449.1 NADH dehydrogenase subunit N [Kushneria sinocarnis]